MTGTMKELLHIAKNLAREMDRLSFTAPITHVYNPLDYAWSAHAQYLERFGHGRAEVLMLGMNPGPWGMAQTGVPFGAIEPVRDWLAISGEIGRPADEHPKRPVTGFACPRSEVSGVRVWSWAEQLFGTPDAFFERIFIHNYCPLIFLEESGRNLTPDKIRAAERNPMLEACDRALKETVQLLEPKRVVGFGVWAEKRAKAALTDIPGDIEIGRILHPSPASPAANRGWAEQATRQFQEMGVDLP